jgi:hypothetical protein
MMKSSWIDAYEYVEKLNHLDINFLSYAFDISLLSYTCDPRDICIADQIKV